MSADAVLAWNQVMLDACAVDAALSTHDEPGPTATSRAFAIVSASVFDALNSISHNYQPYLTELAGYEGADADAAVSAAAYTTLRELYPQQLVAFDAAYASWLAQIPDGQAEDLGVELGQRIASAILAARADDGSDVNTPYTPLDGAGYHQPDPNNPNQGFLGPSWGQVDTFVIGDVNAFEADPPPALTSAEYAAAYQQVLDYGGDGVTTPTLRTDEQTQIGIFWAYDGTPGLGTPPRLYNQIVQVIAQDQGNTMEENARLFALVNLAMADAGIQCWDVKYDYNFWRPVVAIRAGDQDGNDLTVGDPTWNPLGAPATNGGPGALNFTPPFPSYGSGHASFGAAAFTAVANFYGTDQIPFDFMSDEFNGINKDVSGDVRPVVVRHYDNLTDAIWENAISRIYLGIHWIFDATAGVDAGTKIGDYVTAHALLPREASTDGVFSYQADGKRLDIILSINADTAQIIDRRTGEILALQQVSGLSQVVIVGSNANDRIEIVMSPDAPTLSGGIWIDGGQGNGDRVKVHGIQGRKHQLITDDLVQLGETEIHLTSVEAIAGVPNAPKIAPNGKSHGR